MIQTHSQSQLWFPIHPRFVLLLRIVGGAVALVDIYVNRADYHWLMPASLLLWFLFIRPELRPRTPWNLFAVHAHWLLIVILLACTGFVLVAHLLHR